LVDVSAAGAVVIVVLTVPALPLFSSLGRLRLFTFSEKSWGF
jgi:hypothetical protein